MNWNKNSHDKKPEKFRFGRVFELGLSDSSWATMPTEIWSLTLLFYVAVSLNCILLTRIIQTSPFSSFQGKMLAWCVCIRRKTGLHLIIKSLFYDETIHIQHELPGNNIKNFPLFLLIMWEVWWCNGWYPGLQVESSGCKTWPSYCVVFLGQIIYFHCAS